MQKNGLIFSLVFLLTILFGCQQNVKEITSTKAEIQEVPNSKEEITISVEKKELPVSVDQIEVIFKNDNDLDFTYSLLPSIEKNVEGTWYVLPYQQDIAIKAIEPGIGSQTKKTESFSLELLNKELSPGKYRIVHTFYSKETGDKKENVTVAAQFELVE